MNQFLSIVVVFIIGAAGLVAFFAVMDLFFPKRIGKTQMTAEAMPGRSFLVGLINMIFFTVIGMVFVMLGDRTGVYIFPIIGMVFLALMSLGAIFGIASIVRIVGERLAPERHGWMRTAWGAIALLLACILPFVGWFGMAPFVVIYGLGAFVTGLFYRSPNGEEGEEIVESALPL